MNKTIASGYFILEDISSPNSEAMKSIDFAMAMLIYGLIPSGSLLTIYLYAAVNILVVSRLGLVISNYSNTMQQAMFVMFFFMLILILLSGLYTPITSMPEWAQIITKINSLNCFIQVMRSISKEVV
ncbi:ABC transporter permease [Dysgonomonas sp. BGC7]|uniref:ABC transporter permease n=1 Tax=Dysgonomonas sp. BGC7 TaxID=1658008 RepID=UPI0006819C63|nr:ABC transporter permease [Dysgonomonas sp. BGC7]